ncbi:MAG: tetratricopeptide repeat protein [Planctomycetes bacterium]|nr:tetratricopeptide repeat protein [Planctomycetota bacterium]
MNTIAQPQVSVIRKAALLLFLASGATGLIYEVVWMRSLGTVFGNTVLAASTVLTAFMLGLALGGWWLGRRADRIRRPLRVYAYLELGIGIYALAFPALLLFVDRFYLWFYQACTPGFHVLNLVRFAVSMVLLLPPAFLMGGTLPILSALWTIPVTRDDLRRRTGQSVGLLYAVNTFGAVAGTFLAGYYLIRVFGVSRSIYLTAGANLLIGILALLLSLGVQPRRAARDLGPQDRAQKTAPPGLRHPHADRRKRTAVLAGIFVAGFCALALEVLWTRVLVFVLETSVYAFACMLTCFIFGLAVGSLLSSRLLVPRLKDPIFSFGLIEFLLALSVAGSIPLLGLLWHIDLFVMENVIGPRVSFLSDLAVHCLDALAITLVPTVLMGMVFPIAVQVCAPAWETVSRRVGQVYAWNTMGCVAGAFLAGFVLIPQLGLRYSFFLIIGILFALAVSLLLLAGKPRAFWALPVAVVAVALAVVGVVYVDADVFLRTMNTYHYPSKIVFIDDGVTGTVTVHDLPDGDRLIAVDGVDVAGMNLMLRTTQKLQGYAPLLVHPDPQDVVQIGYGSGETCGIGLDFGVANYTIVDICPGVFTAGEFFRDINRGSYAHPRLRKVIMDGKNFIKLTKEKFDVIMNDSTYPGTTGSSALYTYDHFRACRARLKPGGVLSCWVPIDLRLQDMQIIVRSFQAAMPYCSLWMVNNCLNKHAVLLGTLEPMRLDLRRIGERMRREGVAADLRQISIHSPYDLVDCAVVMEEGLRNFAGTGPLHTDDRPHLEFGVTVKRNWEECWLAVLDAIRRHHAPLESYVTNAMTLPGRAETPQTILQQYYEGTKYTLQGMVGMLQGDPTIVSPAFERARKANPHDRDVESILAELEGEIQALENAVREKPNAPDLRSRLAQRYMILKRYAQAVEQYEWFLRLQPRRAAAWNNLALCYQGVGQIEKAVAAFERAAQEEPGLSRAYENLAQVHVQQRNYGGARQALERLLPLLPPLAQAGAHDDLARLCVLQDRYDLALAHLDAALALARGTPSLWQELSLKRQRVAEKAAARERHPPGRSGSPE